MPQVSNSHPVQPLTSLQKRGLAPIKMLGRGKDVPVYNMPYNNVVGPMPSPDIIPLTSMAAVERYVLRDTIQQYDEDYSLVDDTLMQDLTSFGLMGLDGKKKAPVAKPAPTMISGKATQPIKSSTVVAVVGGAALFALGAAALWAYTRKK